MAVARAAGQPELSGQVRFLCDPEPVAVGDLAAAIAAESGRRGRLVRVPDAVVRLLGGAETLVETLTRRSRPFNADKARELLAGDWLCDAGPVARELSLPAPIPLREGLSAAWSWYRAAGWLPLPPGGAAL